MRAKPPTASRRGGTIMIDLTITLTLDEAKVLLHSAQRDFHRVP
jgi:hypothetical protein